MTNREFIESRRVYSIKVFVTRYSGNLHYLCKFKTLDKNNPFYYCVFNHSDFYKPFSIMRLRKFRLSRFGYSNLLDYYKL